MQSSKANVYATQPAAAGSPGVIAASVPRDLLEGLATGHLELGGGFFAIHESDGGCVLEAAGTGVSVPPEDAARRRDAAEAARGVEVEKRHGGGVYAYTFPIFSGPDVAGTIQYLHCGAAEPDAIRRQLRISARAIGALVQAAGRVRSLESVGAAPDRDAILAAALDAAGAAAGLLEFREDPASRTERLAGHESAVRLRRLAANAAGAPVIQETDAGWEAALPLIAGGRETGVLALAFAPSRRLGEEDRAFLRVLAPACAQALERARLRDAEARVRAERDHLRAQLAAEERLRDEVIDALPISIAMCSGPRHMLEFSNPQRLRLWGGRNPLGTPMAEGYPELGGLAAAADSVYATGEPFRMQATPVRIAGGSGEAEERFFDIALLPRRGPAGEVCGVMAFGIEVTAQVRTRLELEREHAFMEAVLDQMPSGVTIAEAPTGRIVLVNDEGERLLRHAVPRVGTLAEYRVFHAEHLDGRPYETHELPLVRSLTSGESVHQEDMIYPRGDGSVAVLAINAAPIRDEAGRIIAAVCTFHDITERRKERDALRRQSRLLNLSHDAIIAATAGRVVTAWNTGAEETYGWTAAEAGGKLVHKLLRTSGFEEIDAVLLRDGRWEGELRHTRKDGSEILVESCQALVRDDRGQPAAILEINRDITARKQAEEALRESEQWLRFCQQATGVGIGDFDLVTGRRKCSEQLYRLYGFEPGDPAFTNETWLERIHPDDRERVLHRLEAARGGGDPFEAEFRVVPPGMPERWVGAKATVFFDGRRPVRSIVAALDITERKRSEQAHYSAQKLESVGILAGGIAHDFNNLLTGILGNASLLLPDMDADAAERIQAIMTGAQKAADLTRQLLAYAGKGRFVVRETDLADTVRDMTHLVRISIPRQVELKRELGQARVSADGGQIQQVIMSLVMNAAEAIGERQAGVVRISTGVERTETPLVTATGETLPPGDYAWLEVADTGCGMDEATRARIFDPFFTTKFLGRGLGLAAVAGIVRSHKGGIRIETAPGKGSTFRVLIPAVDTAAPLPKPGVLVVDDEETVRDFLKRVLEGRGFEVVCACDGREALRILDEGAGEIGLVVLDAVMPVMGGGETLAAIRARQPGLKVLLTSGYSEDEVHRLFGVAKEGAFIQKPYTAQQLAEKVKSVLEG